MPHTKDLHARVGMRKGTGKGGGGMTHAWVRWGVCRGLGPDGTCRQIRQRRLHRSAGSSHLGRHFRGHPQPHDFAQAAQRGGRCQRCTGAGTRRATARATRTAATAGQAERRRLLQEAARLRLKRMKRGRESFLPQESRHVRGDIRSGRQGCSGAVPAAGAAHAHAAPRRWSTRRKQRAAGGSDGPLHLRGTTPLVLVLGGHGRRQA
jgi:hypothetical protein